MMESMFKLRKFGEFSVPWELVTQQGELFYKFIRKYVVIDARDDFLNGKIHYKVMSEEFREVEKGVEMPRYKVKYSVEKDELYLEEMQ